MKKTLTAILFLLLFIGCEYDYPYDKEDDTTLTSSEFQQLLKDIGDDAENMQIPEVTYNSTTEDYELSPATSTLTLASVGEKGTTVTWQSLNTAVITETGVVLSHPAGTHVTLVAFVSKHGINDSKVFYILFL